MIPWIWFVRAKRWAQNPPSWGRVMLGLGVIAICLFIVAIEWLGFWPEALTSERPGRILR